MDLKLFRSTGFSTSELDINNSSYNMRLIFVKKILFLAKMLSYKKISMDFFLLWFWFLDSAFLRKKYLFGNRADFEECAITFKNYNNFFWENRSGNFYLFIKITIFNLQVSWGKVKGSARAVKVCADATLVFPLVVARTFARSVELQKQKDSSLDTVRTSESPKSNSALWL